MCGDILTFTRMEGFNKLSKISAKFREKTKLYLFIDFDLSLVLDNHWSLLSGTFSESGKQKNSEIDRKYMEKHITKNLTEIEELSWMSDKIQLFKEENVGLENIKSVAKNIKLRRNAKALIDIFKPENTIIISYGIYDIISEFVETNELGNVTIFANRLAYDCNNTLDGFDQSSVVTPNLKGKILTDYCIKNDIDFRNIVVIGDSKGDETMFLKNTLNILVNTNGNIHSIKNVDLILKTTDFKPVVLLITQPLPKYY